MREPLTAPPRPATSRSGRAKNAAGGGTTGGGGAREGGPKRAMVVAAQKGNRRRAWPRWTRPALEGLATLSFMAAIGAGLWWTWQSGVVGSFVAELGGRMVDKSVAVGFSVREVFVEGRVATKPETVLKALGVGRGDPLLTFDVTAARDRLADLPWVLDARVERRLPDSIFVQLTERQPMAIWQHEGKMLVIDDEGRPLGDAVDLAARGDKTLEHLPQVVGAGANERARHLLDALSHVPVIERRVTAAVLVGERRWNLTLDNRMTVQLPEERMERALGQLARLEMGEGVFNRDVVSVDLRQADRMTLKREAAEVEPKRDPKAAHAPAKARGKT